MSGLLLGIVLSVCICYYYYSPKLVGAVIIHVLTNKCTITVVVNVCMCIYIYIYIYTYIYIYIYMRSHICCAKMSYIKFSVAVVPRRMFYFGGAGWIGGSVGRTERHRHIF